MIEKYEISMRPCCTKVFVYAVDRGHCSLFHRTYRNRLINLLVPFYHSMIVIWSFTQCLKWHGPTSSIFQILLRCVPNVIPVSYLEDGIQWNILASKSLFRGAHKHRYSILQCIFNGWTYNVHSKSLKLSTRLIIS